MTIPNWLFAALIVYFGALAGCKKAQQPTERAGESYGVKVDWAKWDGEFANASPDLQTSASLTKRFLRYGQFPRAMAELEKLSNAPTVSESQKKLVNDLIEQTKQAAAKAPSPEP